MTSGEPATLQTKAQPVANWRTRPAVRVLIAALAYALAVRIGLAFVVQPAAIAAIWPASGVALAAYLLGRRQERLAILAAIFGVNVLSNMLVAGSPLAASAGLALANTAEPALCGWLVLRLAGEGLGFTRVAEVLALAAAAALANGATALLGALVAALAFGAPYWTTWLAWWLADGLGILALTPFIVCWLRNVAERRPARLARRLEIVVMLLVVVAVTYFIFVTTPGGVLLEPRVYMLFPFLIWIALRANPRGASTGLVLMGTLALGATVLDLDRRPLGGENLLERLTAVQAFVCIVALTILILAAAISERRRVERVLTENRTRLDLALQSALMGAWIADLIANRREFDLQACRVLGIDPATFSGNPDEFYGRVHPDDLPMVKTQLANAIAHGTLYEPEYRAVWPDGSVHYVSSRGRLVRDEAGQAARVTGIIWDITGRKQAEAERERLLAELEHKNKDLESIVYAASHDLRSPLVNVQGFSQKLLKHIGQVTAAVRQAESLEGLRAAVLPLLEERIPTALRFVESSSSKMDTLIAGMLRLSRAGRVSLQVVPVDMNLLLQNVVESMAFQIEKSGARLEVQPDLPPCKGDRGQLGQVFSNLLDNALKYRDPDRPLVVGISCRPAGGRTVYVVADNGRGIAPEQQERIWELFRRLDEGSIPGEGLGLTITRRIVERHGGRVWVESEPGVGSRFCVELPITA